MALSWRTRKQRKLNACKKNNSYIVIAFHCRSFSDHLLCFQLHYISPSLGGGGTASPAAVTSVFTYVGTPPPLRRQSRLTWRQGPAHLFEDIVSTSSVSTIYTLGPNYVGSFQSPILGEFPYIRLGLIVLSPVSIRISSPHKGLPCFYLGLPKNEVPQWSYNLPRQSSPIT